MAPGFQKLVNKWVKISRNNVDTPTEASHPEWSSKGMQKIKCEDSTGTAATSTFCPSYDGGSLVDQQETPIAHEDPVASCTCENCSDIHEKVKEYVEFTKYFEKLSCNRCQKVLSDAIEAAESVKTTASDDDEMSKESSSDDSGAPIEAGVEQSQAGAFLQHLAAFVEKQDAIPFDLIDLWVPVFPSDAACKSAPRLCHAGHIVASNAPNKGIKQEFGQSSMIYSFEPGYGIPGRVFTSGLPIWESDLSASSSFKRCNAAKKHGINTCLGLPVDSTIGRIVAIFYTEHQLSRRDEHLIHFIQSAITSNCNPNPTWTLELDSATNDQSCDFPPPIAPYSDLSSKPPPLQPAVCNRHSSPSSDINKCINFQIANLLAEQMPMGESPLSSGYVSLRLVLLRSARSTQEEEMLTILRRSYHGYIVIQRSSQDMALLLVQDYMYLQSSVTRRTVRSNAPLAMRSVSYSDMSMEG